MCWHRDVVKIDVNYLNRSPLLPPRPMTVTPVQRRCGHLPPQRSDLVDRLEVEALIERVDIRDLYDVSRIAAIYPQLTGPDDHRLARRMILYCPGEVGALPAPLRRGQPVPWPRLGRLRRAPPYAS